MSKKEILWRHILIESLEKKVNMFTQKNLAKQFGYSTSTIFNALKAPRKLGSIEVTGRYFRLRDAEKLLLLWATIRNFRKNIIYETFVDESPRGIEGGMPSDVIFGTFSAYRLKYNEAPADYSAVSVYSDNPREIEKRFPQSKKKRTSHNLFVLKADPYLKTFGTVTPDVQTFVDLWNISDWYAKDYVKALKVKMNII